MYLKSLELNGFKSFGKKAQLEFTSPITAVVGPNGSGKSNVAEAFRFGLGEQSLKSMRGKRGEDLIFSGSDQGGRLNRGSVKIVFDNSKKILPLDFDEVSLERIVHRDGGNDYFINSSPARLKDIQELLSHAHIGASGHHIISQGEADRILSANIKERRAMIEDALGLKIFQYKKLESERKLERTDENVKQVESLRRELAPHLKFLRKQVEKIERAESLREELRISYKEYLKRESLYIDASRLKIKHNLKEPEAELALLGKRLDDIRAKLSIEEQSNKQSLELIETEKSLRTTSDEKQSLTHAIGRIEGEIASIIRMMERAERMKMEDSNRTVYMRDVESLLADIRKEISVAEKTDALDIIKSALGKVKVLFEVFITNHRSASTDDASGQYREDIGRLEKEKTDFEKKFQTKEKEEAELRVKIAELNESIKEVKEGSMDAERAMFQTIARQKELEGIVNALRTEESKLRLEEDEFKREIAEACVLAGRDMSEYALVEVVTIENEDRSAQNDRRKHVEKLKIRLEELGGGSADDTMREFKETEERDAFLARELEDLKKSSEDLFNLIKELEVKLDLEFKHGIDKINKEFQKYFELLFGGGKASLRVIKEEKRKNRDTDLDIEGDMGTEEENINEGIDIAVDLPKKKVKALMMLSGGERALTSIALLFAMSQVNPPPFIILDETDAALDEANSKKYGDMIENLSAYSQLIVITHNRETMSRAGVLYGVTMMSGLSKLLSIKFDEAVQVAK